MGFNDGLLFTVLIQITGQEGIFYAMKLFWTRKIHTWM